jgi:endonuclease G
MVPKAAMSKCYGQATVNETYVLSNACPQLHEFNDGIWGDLEDLVREEYSVTCEEVWVIVGPIFDDCNGRAYLVKEAEYASLAQKPVEIPDAFYAILIDLVDGSPRVLAFVMAQGAGRGSSAPRKERLAPYLTSVDAIEAYTGLDFLWLLDDPAEAGLESATATALW